MPGSNFWGALMQGVGESAQVEQKRRWEQEDRERMNELNLLMKIPMEELDPTQQETVLRKQIELIQAPQKGKKGRKAQEAIEQHPVLNLFRAMRPTEETAGTAQDLRGLPAPPAAAGGMAAPWSSDEEPFGQVPVTGPMSGAGLQAPPVPLTTAAAMTLASPAKARKLGMFGPSWAAKERIKREEELGTRRDELAMAKEAEDALVAARLGRVGQLPPDDARYARYNIIAGTPFPSLPAPHRPRLEEEFVTVVGPDGKPVGMTAAKAAQLGYPKWQGPGVSAFDKTKLDRIRGIMLSGPLGMSEAEAEIQYLREKVQETRDIAEGRKWQTATNRRTALEPSPGARTFAGEEQHFLDQIEREARAEGAKLREMKGRVAFYMAKGREPTEADILKAQEEYAAAGLARSGRDPDRIAAMREEIRRRFQLGGAAAPAVTGKAPNPTWVPGR